MTNEETQKKIEIRIDNKSKKFLIDMIKYDECNGGEVFESLKGREDFKEHIAQGEIPKEHYFALWDLIGLYRGYLSKEDGEHIEYIYAQATEAECA